MDIPSALELLRNAPTQVLQHHRNEAVAAFREIEARLRGYDSNEIASIQMGPSHRPVSGQVAEMRPNASAKLLGALSKVSSWVLKSTKLEPNQILHAKRSSIRDTRLSDVHRVEGDPKAANNFKLLRGLAQRSLALEGEKSGYLDIKRACEVASSRGKLKTNKGRQGKIASYVTYGLGIEEEDREFAIRAVQAGMRQLVMERLLEERLRPAEQWDSASGISAFTALAVRPFRCLKYGEIPEFLDCLLDPASMDLSVAENEQDIDRPPRAIAEVIQATSVWFDKLQRHYNSRSLLYSIKFD